MATTSQAVRQLSDGNSQGTVLGTSSTDKIGFYGVTTGVILTTGAGQAAVVTTVVQPNAGATTMIATNQGNVFGFSSAASGNQVAQATRDLVTDMVATQLLVNSIRTALVGLGLMQGS